MLQLFDGTNLEALNTARAYVWFNFRKSSEWLESLAPESLPQKTVAQILAALPFSRANWEKARASHRATLVRCIGSRWMFHHFQMGRRRRSARSACSTPNERETPLEALLHSLKGGTAVDQR